MTDGTVSILYGNNFVVSDRNGDIEASPAVPAGLFAFDTRFLSTWVLTVNGERLQALAVDDLQYYESRFFLVPAPVVQYVNKTLSVIRHRWVGSSFEERLTRLIVDLRRVSFLDSSGISALVAGYRAAHQRGIGYLLTNPRNMVWSVLQVTGVLGTLTGTAQAPPVAGPRVAAGPDA